MRLRAGEELRRAGAPAERLDAPAAVPLPDAVGPAAARAHRGYAVGDRHPAVGPHAVAAPLALGPVDALGAVGRGLRVAATERGQGIAQRARGRAGEVVVQEVVDVEGRVAADGHRLLGDRRRRARVAEAHREVAGHAARPPSAQAPPVVRHGVAPEQVQVHQVAAVGDRDELVLVAGAHHRRRRPRPGARADGRLAAARVVRRAPFGVQLVGHRVVVDPAHVPRGDDVDAAVLVGRDAVRHGLERVGGHRAVRARVAVQAEQAQVVQRHPLGLSRDDADDALLGHERDVAVVGHRRADDPVLGTAERLARQLEALDQLDRRRAVAARAVAEDVDDVLARDDEVPVAVEHVVGAADPALSGRRRVGLALRGHVQVDQPPGGGVDLVDRAAVARVDQRSPGGDPAVAVGGRELRLDRDAGQVDVLGADARAGQPAERRRGLRVAVAVRDSPLRVGQRRVAGRLVGRRDLAAAGGRFGTGREQDRQDGTDQ